MKIEKYRITNAEKKIIENSPNIFSEMMTLAYKIGWNDGFSYHSIIKKGEKK